MSLAVVGTFNITKVKLKVGASDEWLPRQRKPQIWKQLLLNDIDAAYTLIICYAFNLHTS